MRAVADAFTIDDTYDRDYATDKVSRYGWYLASHADWFTETGKFTGPYADDPAEFATLAWSVASGPNMSPPYVQTHPLIARAAAYRSSEDGSLIGDIILCSDTPPPALLDLGGWGGWHHEHGRLYEPSARDIGRQARMLTSVRLMFRIDPELLYVPQDAPERLTVSDAKSAVARVAELLDAKTAPALAQLEGSR